LSSWVTTCSLPQTSSYSYLRVVVIWIDVNPAKGKSDQHATRFLRSVRICPSTIHISHDSHIATFHVVINRVEQDHCSWEKGLSTQSTARRLTDPRVRTQFLSWANQWSSGEQSQPSVDDRLLSLLGSYYRHVIGTFNTCSRGQFIGP
jgi:hypothetical protein